MSTDGETNCILIEKEGAPVESAEKVDIISGPRELPDSIIQKYADATGTPVIRLRDLAKRSLMGELVQKLGAARMGSAMLLESEEMIKEGIKLIDQMLGDYAHDPKAIASLMKARYGFTDLWVKAAEAHIASKKDSPDDSNKGPQNMPPPPLVPVQINISGNQVSTEQPLK